MSERDLTTTVSQVFGDVAKGTECRVCGRDVTDGRAKYCSDYCRDISQTVMRKLNWTSVRRKVIQRDDRTCQECGYDGAVRRKAARHVKAIIDEKAGERPRSDMSLSEPDSITQDEIQEHQKSVEKWEERRQKLKEEYGDPREIRDEKTLEVDHITPIAEGGHPFDPDNLQTLCEDCHGEKTREQLSKPSPSEVNESLDEYAADGGGSP